MTRNPRNRRRGSRRGSERFDSEETPSRAREVIDERVVKVADQFGATRDDFKVAGFTCRNCGYVTKKRGFNGRQALRAHLKRHVRERRAVLRPLFIQVAVAVLTLAIYLVAPVVSSNFLPMDEQIDVFSAYVLLPERSIEIAVVAVPSIMVLAHWAAALKLDRAGRNKSRRLTSVMLWTNSVMLPVAGIIASGALGTLLWPGWFAGFLALWLSNMFLAPAVSRLKLGMARREYQPSGYAPLFRTVSAEIDARLSAFRGRIRRAIYRGDLDPEKTDADRRRILEALGLGHVKPRPRSPRPRQAGEERSSGNSRER
jgi:hypothetical protein